MKEIPVAFSGNLAVRYKNHDGRSYYPIQLLLKDGLEPTDDGVILLSVSEAEAMRDALTQLLEGPPKTYVKVSVIGHDDKEWNYEDPTGELQKDDLVRVEFGTVEKVGIVRSTTDSYPSWLTHVKPVLAKFTAEEL